MPERFLARDVYPTWKRRVRAAQASVWVLTPYLDHSVVSLLSNAEATIEQTLVTDLSPEAGPANYRKKLLALKKLLERDVDVRALPRLHAKVLVVDGATIVAGSQNFTSYARSSREVSAWSETVEAPALRTIGQWVTQSRSVDLELIDVLLAATEKQAKVVGAVIADLTAQVNELVTELDRQRAERVHQAAERAEAEAEPQAPFGDAARALESRVSKTPWRLAMGSAFLVPDTATTYSEWYGEHEYPTMYGANAWGNRSDVNMTQWFRGRGESLQTLKLRHLHFYPVIHLPAGRMVFARIAQTRITYVKHSIRFTNPYEIDGGTCYLGLTLPEELNGGANMVVEVRPWAEASVVHRIGVQLDGESFQVKWERAATGTWASQAAAAAQVVLSELERPQRGPELIQQLLEPVKFTELGRDNKNAAAFFGYKRHELKLIEFGSAELFVAVRQ